MTRKGCNSAGHDADENVTTEGLTRTERTLPCLLHALVSSPPSPSQPFLCPLPLCPRPVTLPVSRPVTLLALRPVTLVAPCPATPHLHGL
jgi:hypothetical protein